MLFPPRVRKEVSFPADLARAVELGWETLVGGEWTAPARPTGRALSTLLTTAYQATLSAEEGRACTFTLIWSESAPPRRSLGPHLSETMVLDQPRPFSTEELRKLSPALSASATAMWVAGKGSKASPFEIRGFADLGRNWESGRAGFTYSYQPPPRALIVTGRGPGSVTVSQGEFEVASLHGGKLTHFSTNYILERAPLTEHWHGFIKNAAKEIVWPEVEEPRETDNFLHTAYLNVFLAIVNSIRYLKHGGSLVLLEKRVTTRRTAPINIRYKFAGGALSLREAFLRWVRERNAWADQVWKMEETSDADAEPLSAQQTTLDAINHRLLNMEDLLAKRCASIGRLSGVDGAVVISPELEVLGFGAELLARPPSPNMKFAGPPFPRDEPIAPSALPGGMRHRSALRFAAQTGALVWVISQDGPVTLFARENSTKKLRIYRNFRTTSANMI